MSAFLRSIAQTKYFYHGWHQTFAELRSGDHYDFLTGKKLTPTIKAYLYCEVPAACISELRRAMAANEYASAIDCIAYEYGYELEEGEYVVFNESRNHSLYCHDCGVNPDE